ncbi:hypothetical protein FXO37_12270 [Capsicum annuum]|nr:hypothetical protein FXO37_12270 [Capsicum annuum]
MQEFDPFSLSIDGDKLRGRGTTDCLGHVALVSELMKRLGETKPQLKCTVVAVFIASEENSSIPGVGVDALVKDGLLDKLKQGPLFWIDTADKQPCIGTGGSIPWKLHVTGKLFHSGLAHKLILTIIRGNLFYGRLSIEDSEFLDAKSKSKSSFGQNFKALDLLDDLLSRQVVLRDIMVVSIVLFICCLLKYSMTYDDFSKHSLTAKGISLPFSRYILFMAKLGQFGKTALVCSVYRKQPLYFFRGSGMDFVHSILPSPAPTMWEYTGFVVVVALVYNISICALQFYQLCHDPNRGLTVTGILSPHRGPETTPFA